jgi:hypothetical protein
MVQLMGLRSSLAKATLLLVLAGMTAANVASAYSVGPLSLNGGLNLAVSGYGVSGITSRQSPFSWVVTGDPSLSLYGISVPFSFVLSEQERSFRQPFDQFGLSPSWRWATVHLGYRNLNWSPYTFAGQTIYGAGLELNPGWLRLGAIYGRFRRAVKEDTVAVPPDSVEQTPAYRRAGYALKLGFGRPANYVDFTFIRAADDSTSLPNRPVKTELMPAENAALGISARQAIGRILSFDLDLAASILNRDQASPAIASDNWVFKALSSVITPRASASYFIAGRTSLSLHLGPFDAIGQYERVEPEYTTMGVPSLTSDVSRLTLTPTLRLLGDRLDLSGTVGSEQDNLHHTKLATTGRTIWSAHVGLNPDPRWGVDAQVGNYATKQQAGTQALNDTTRMKQVNRNLTLSPHVSIVSGTVVHSIAVAFDYSGLADDNAFTRAENNSNSVTLVPSYSLSAAAGSIVAAGTFARVTTNAGPTSVTGMSLSGTKPLLSSRLTLSLSPSFAVTRIDTVVAKTLTAQAGVDFRPQARHLLHAGLTYTSSTAAGTAQPKFAEFKATSGYTLSF